MGSPHCICLCLRCCFAWLRQESCRCPSRMPASPESEREPCFTTGPRAASGDAAGLGWLLPAEQGGFVTGVQNDAPLRVLSAPPSPPQTFRPGFPSPRLVHVILIKRKKASGGTGAAAVSREAVCVFFFNWVKELCII